MRQSKLPGGKTPANHAFSPSWRLIYPTLFSIGQGGTGECGDTFTTLLRYSQSMHWSYSTSALAVCSPWLLLEHDITWFLTPYTTATTAAVPPTGLQSLTNSLLVTRLFGIRPVLGVVACWQTCLLWSSVGSADTAALHSLAVRGLEPAVREGPRHKTVSSGISRQQVSCHCCCCFAGNFFPLTVTTRGMKSVCFAEYTTSCVRVSLFGACSSMQGGVLDITVGYKLFQTMSQLTCNRIRL